VAVTVGGGSLRGAGCAYFHAARLVRLQPTAFVRPNARHEKVDRRYEPSTGHQAWQLERQRHFNSDTRYYEKLGIGVTAGRDRHLKTEYTIGPLPETFSGWQSWQPGSTVDDLLPGLSDEKATWWS